MKKILQAAALILLAGSVIYAAARTSNKGTATCHSEWEKVLDSKKQGNENQYAEK